MNAGIAEVGAVSRWKKLTRHELLGEMLAEFVGTLILMLFGVGVVAQVVAGGLGDHDSIAWAWGFGVMLGVYVAGKDHRRRTSTRR